MRAGLLEAEVVVVAGGWGGGVGRWGRGGAGWGGRAVSSADWRRSTGRKCR